MKQKIKRVFLVLCVAVCLLALSACGKSEEASGEPVSQDVIDTMKSGAENYLKQFDSYDDAAIETQKRRMEKQDNAVLVTALDSWKSVKNDLGKLVSILSEDVVRVDEESYQITITASYEKREMEFTLTAEEMESSAYAGGITLVPTELVFSPFYTTGEKLTKALMNTLMGMGTVFVVLIFISFIISRFKNINEWEAKRRAAQEEKAKTAEQAQTPANPAPVPVPSPAVEETAAPVEEVAPEENLADDLELAAVITAAISAAADVPAEGLVVRSIRRKSAAKWKNA